MCDSCDHHDFIDELTEMLNDADYEWAEDTISGILETVRYKFHVTDRQRDAIENIKNAVEDRRR